MRKLLDTNVWIHLLKTPTGRCAKQFRSTPKHEIVTCSIVRAELMHGALKYGNRQKRTQLIERSLAPFVSYAFDDEDAEVYADIRNALELSGTPIGPYDLQIAAIAVRRQLTVVTGNVREFSRVEGLKVEDWS